MSYLVLARKYRPQTFDEVISQEHVTRTLSNAISSGRVAHAILFSGPRGTGKTTIARILAKAMNCQQGPTPTPCNQCQSCKEITAGNAVDVFEIDGASNNGVDHIRDLRENVRYLPSHSPYKIYIIDEVHMLSVQAFNALLKTLEEPPPHVMFLFATTEPHKIPITILSRCQRHDLRRVTLPALTAHLQSLCSREGIQFSNESLSIIAREAGGSVRDALSLLDQVMICSEETLVRDEQVMEILGVVDRQIIFDLSAAVLRNDLPEILELIEQIYEYGHNLKEVYSDVIEHFRNLLVIKIGKRVDRLVDVPAHERTLMMEQVRNVSEFQLRQIMDVLFKEEVSVKLSAHPKLAVEMAFIRLIETKPVLPIDILIEKLDALKNSLADSIATPAAVSVPQPAGINQPEPPPFRKLPLVNETQQTYSVLNSSTPEKPAANLMNLTPETAWKPLIEKLSTHTPSLSVVLEKCTLKHVEGTQVEIEVNGNGFNLKTVTKHKQLVEQVYSELLNQPISVKISVKEKSGGVASPIGQTERLKTEALNHPMVTAALEIFQGKVVDIKLLPQTQRR